MKRLLLTISVCFILACGSNSKVLEKYSVKNGDTLISTNSINLTKDSITNDTSKVHVKVKQDEKKLVKDTLKPIPKVNGHDKTMPHVHPKDPKVEHIKDSLNKIKRRK